jgi:predicted nuclease with TOPRIM domain
LILDDKVKVMQRENRELKIEQKKLLQTLEKLKNENKELKNQVNTPEDFNNSKKIAKIVSSKLKQAGETAEWKGIVEEIIEEIDRCVELLKAY